MKTPYSITSILSPALTAIALSAFIAGCTPDSNDDGMLSSSKSETLMQDSSAWNKSSVAISSTNAMHTSSTTSVAISTAAVSSQSTMDDTSAYQDGTYSAEGIYRSPAGGEVIHVTLTLDDDVITTAQVEGAATNPKSIKMQDAFIAGFGAQVIGRPIDGLSLGVVNGSSLTPKGFMDAVTKIKAEAL